MVWNHILKKKFALSEKKKSDRNKISEGINESKTS